MKVTKELVQYVAQLSRIYLDEEKVQKMEKELEEVIGYMDILNTLDTKEIEPLSHIFPITNVMREDQGEPSWRKEDILKNMPEVEEGMPAVPRTID